jgi:VWFA-related protein
MLLLTTSLFAASGAVQFTLLLDVSESMRAVIGSEERVARIVFHDMDQGQGSAAELVRFATTANSSGQTPNSVPKLKATGLTALYDSLCDFADSLAADGSASVAPAKKLGKSDRQRILVVLSDGEDNLSRHTLADAILALQRADAVVFPVTIHSRRWQYRWQYIGDAALEQIAAATGGQVFRLRNYQQLEEVIADIKAGRRAQYEIGFRLPDATASGFHRVEVRLPDRTWEVRAKSGYYIP